MCVLTCLLSCARVDTRNHFMVLGWRPISYYCQLLLWRTAVKRNGDDDDDDGGIGDGGEREGAGQRIA